MGDSVSRALATRGASVAAMARYVDSCSESCVTVRIHACVICAALIPRRVCLRSWCESAATDNTITLNSHGNLLFQSFYVLESRVHVFSEMLVAAVQVHGELDFVLEVTDVLGDLAEIVANGVRSGDMLLDFLVEDALKHRHVVCSNNVYLHVLSDIGRRPAADIKIGL